MTAAQTITDPVQVVLGRLDRVKAVGNGQWMARCPAHDDRKPSLSIKVGNDGQALVYCHAKCALDDVLAATNPPTTMAELFPSSKDSVTTRNGERQIVETYDYVDISGVLLYQVVRYDPKDFRLRRPDAEGGWTWSIKGVERVLYRLQEVTRAPDHCMVYPLEGEKDVDRLIAAGMVATCNSGGAGKWKFTDDTPLHGRHVAIIPDNDQSGRAHAQDVAQRLHGKAKSVRIVELPDHHDVSDWLDAGNNPADLDELASQAPEWTPGSIISSDIASTSGATALTTAEPYRDRQASMDAINQMAETGRKIRERGYHLARQIAEWLDRKGPEALFETIDHPIPYVAAALGISRAHFHKLGQIGRVLRCRTLCDNDVNISERAILPLARLLEHNPEAIPKALETAHELAKADAAREGRTKPRPVRPKHTSAAVDEIIGPAPKHTPVRRRHPADTVAARALLLHLSKAIDIAAMLNLPSDLDMLIKAVGKHPHIKVLGGLP